MNAQLFRYSVVIVAGLLCDITVALAVNKTLGLPLWLSAAVGFVCGAAVNYILHEKWTFTGGEQRLSSRRARKFGLVVGATFLVRIFSVWVLGFFLVWPLAILVVALAISFATNYYLSSKYVFAPQPNNFRNTQMTATKFHVDWELPEFNTLELRDRLQDYALVIPVINEGCRIQNQLKRIQNADLPVDVVVADGGSTDGSLEPEFLESVAVRARLTKTGPGKLSAQLRMAYAWCLAEGYQGIVTIDGNGKDGVDAVSDFVRLLEEGYGYVQGSRYKKGGVAENTPLERTIGNRMIHAPMLSLAGRHWFTDTTNGFRGYSSAFLLDDNVAPFRSVFMNYELLFYLTVRAGQLGYRVTETPVRRTYPKGEATPTKITGNSAKWALFKQTFQAAAGKFTPRN